MISIKELLQSPKVLHFIGVGGSGMYPIAQILLSAGHTIQGSDVNEGAIIDYERGLGMKIFMGHAAQNVTGADLVVYSAAIGTENPERAQAEALGIPCVERSIMLGYVSSLYAKPVCFAGTHGKTTATGMCTQILQQAGLDPAAVIGGRLPLINAYGKAGSGEGIVVEACEFNNTFLQLYPHAAVLLNVDNDHLDFFGSMENLKAAFALFCSQAIGCVLYNADDENTLDVIKRLQNKKTLSFGFNENSDYQALNAHEYKPAYWAFTLKDENGETEIRLGAPGRHNIHNALAAYAGARQLGASSAQCAHGLEAFAGTGRRFEFLGKKNGITVADDYAHHPTEVEAVIKTATSMNYSNVWIVFQPYTYSRTELLLDEFAQVLAHAPKLVMTEIMGGREKESDYDVRTANLAAKLPGSVWYNTQQECADYIIKNAQNGDLVLTVGCGDIYKCAKLILNGL